MLTPTAWSPALIPLLDYWQQVPLWRDDADVFVVVRSHFLARRQIVVVCEGSVANE